MSVLAILILSLPAILLVVGLGVGLFCRLPIGRQDADSLAQISFGFAALCGLITFNVHGPGQVIAGSFLVVCSLIFGVCLGAYMRHRA